MHISRYTLAWLTDILESDLFLQLVPFLLLFFVPIFILLLTTTVNPARLLYTLNMGLENIGVSFSWLFPQGSGVSSRLSTRKAKKLRNRAEHVVQNDSKCVDEGYYPGLVNISGTYCFMNSTLQALASLSYLQPHLDAINAKAEALDVPTPVIDALQELFRRLNKPHSSYHAIRPTDIIQVFTSQTEGRSNSLFYSREHQDAQELFQVVSECIKNEISMVDKEAYRDRGLSGLSKVPPETLRDIGKSVFDGLTANRRSCCICGYTEAVMHFSLDNWQLAVPRLKATCQLEDCLADYTRLEILADCICRKCSVIATLKRLQQEIIKLEEETGSDKKPSNSKKERLKRVRKMEARVRKAVAEERIEDDIKDVRMEKMISPASTKQAMIARPPLVLALHINRSVHYGHYASKNNVRLIFPEVLDLTPYTTSGNISTVPTSAISTPPPILFRSTTPTPSTYSNPRTIYRLTAVVCHYGEHSFGHYICYRRKPRHPSVGLKKRWAPPRVIDTYRPGDDFSGTSGILNGHGDGMGSDNTINNLYTSSTPHYVFSDEVESRPGKGWLRISDDAVHECGIEAVLQEGMGAFMLYYERAVLDLPGVYSSLGHDRSPRSSEETLKPELKAAHREESDEAGVDVHSPVLLSTQPGIHPYTHEQGSELEEEGPTSGLSANVDLDTRKGRFLTASIPHPTSLPLLSRSPIFGARIVHNVMSRRSASATRWSTASTESTISMEELNGNEKVVNGSYFGLSVSAPSVVDTTLPQVANGTISTTTVRSKSESHSSSESKDKLKHKRGSSDSQQEEVQHLRSAESHHLNGIRA